MKAKTALFATVLGALAVPAIGQMPPAQAWEIGPWVRGRNYSEGMPPNPAPARGGGVTFDFPLAGRGQIDAMTRRVGPLAGAHLITLRYRIDAAPGTKFIADETPDQPATVSVYFQQRGDDWSARGRYASYRWYVPVNAVIPLTPGTRTITVRLDQSWGNVNGRPVSEDPAGFAAALQNTDKLGLAFGSVSRRSHGVYATGPARFTLLELNIG